MTWVRAVNAVRRVVSVFAFPALILRNLRAVMRGSARPTFRSVRAPEPLLWRKEALARDLKKAKRQHKKRRAIYSALKAVNHTILARGVQ